MKYRLRSLLSDATKGEEMAGIELDATGNLKDFLIIRADMTRYPPEMINHALKQLRENVHDKVLMVPDDWELCVLEPMEDDDGSV